MKRFASLLIIIAAVCWGVIGIFTRTLAEAGFSTFQVCAIRCILTGAGFSAFTAIRSPAAFRIDVRDLWMFLGTGVCSVVFFNVCYFTTIEWTTLSAAAILLYTAPLFVVIMSAIFFREKITPRKLAALLLALCGCGFITGVFTGDAGMTPLGILSGLGAGFGYALYSIFGRAALKKYSSVTVTTYTFIAAGICVLPFCRIGSLIHCAYTHPNTLLHILCLAAISTVIPYLLYTTGLQYTEAGKASVMASVEPVVASAVGILLYREPLTFSALLGSVLVLFSVILLNLSPAKKLTTKADLMNYKRLKYACYTANISMSVVGNLSPVLFLTFRSLYGISYSLLGLLVLINFVTQLTIDLIFSFFSHRFHIPKTVKCIPILTVAGLGVYALWPFLFPDAVYAGLVLGTIIFSASGGLAEVLISPVIAAIPAKEPDREMSKLHSVYAWGVVAVIIISTLFLLLFGSENWQWLALLFTLVPLTSAVLFAGADIPSMETPEKASGALALLKNKGLLLCVFAIFLGGAAECTMAQWSSGYLERALAIPKVWGDIFGTAVFSVMLGLGRSLYAKIGKNIGKVLFLGAIGAVICYGTAALSSIPVLGLIACAFTGFCTSMLWPGNLIVASQRFPQGGVFIYAMMAAGGDLGASIAPQLVGIITDLTIASPAAAHAASTLGLASEQLGMKLGMLTGMLFPLIAIFLYYRLWKSTNRADT